MANDLSADIRLDPTPALEVRGRSLWQDARRRLFRNKAAVVSMVVIAIIILLAAFAPYMSVHAYDDPNYEFIGCAPYWWPSDDVFCRADSTYLIGTDGNGRDLFVRMLYGARVSMAVGVVATAVALLIGVAFGATAGYVGGRIDNIMMRFVDVMYALPFIFFVIILMTITRDIAFFKDPVNRFILIFAAIGAVEWLTMARIVRGQTLSIRRKEFVEAAIAAGVSSRAIIFRHVIPNVIGPVIVFATLLIPSTILAESFLSFLGLGVQEPMTSWGVLISDGAGEMETKPWMLIFPALMMAVTLFCFNFIGDGLRDALDPKDR